jgi:hypothetical protein
MPQSQQVKAASPPRIHINDGYDDVESTFKPATSSGMHYLHIYVPFSVTSNRRLAVFHYSIP